MARHTEYCLNKIDEHGDIDDIEFYNTFKEAKTASDLHRKLYFGEYNNIEKRIVYGNDDEGVTDMMYVASWMWNPSTSSWDKLYDS
tara:strand:+ start:185 stop:442 length:258 start_codon:yes stop_codon:yes gene_type:complete